MNLLVAIYNHPEQYPPTLNALTILSREFDRVHLLYRNTVESSWNYPSNVLLHPDKDVEEHTRRSLQALPIRILEFFKFSWKFLRLLRRQRPDWLLMYDSVPLMSYGLIKWLIPEANRPKLWYHNHDVTEVSKASGLIRYSLRFETKCFPVLDLFTLPAEERMEFFPIGALKGAYFTVPNYPSINFISDIKKQKEIKQEIRLIYQGSISNTHGLSECAELTSFKYNKYPITLSLAGPIANSMKADIEDWCKSTEMSVEYMGCLSYQDLAKFTNSGDIGIAIFEPVSRLNQTVGTASNKIYEYAACGLPILYNRTQNLIKHLGEYSWAVGVDIDKMSIYSGIQHILQNYNELSNAASGDFATHLNYEAAMEPVVRYLSNTHIS